MDNDNHNHNNNEPHKQLTARTGQKMDTLTTLTAQYHQQLPPARLAQSIPPAPVLLRPEVQTQLYEHLFNEENPQAWPLPPASYRKRVLKMVVGALEAGATTEDDEILDCLMDAWSELLVQPEGLSDVERAKQLGFIKYTAPYPYSDHPDHYQGETATTATGKSAEERKTIITTESPSVILSSGTTGFRTWEAALHLATYLALDDGAVAQYIHGQRVLELGAGTGLLSLFVARYLGPASVLATDCDDGIVARTAECARVNRVNGLDARVLVWGEPTDTLGDVDTALGADLIYDTDLVPLLVSTLTTLFAKHNLRRFIISATMRNPDTFEVFLSTCRMFFFCHSSLVVNTERLMEQTTITSLSTLSRLSHLVKTNKLDSSTRQRYRYVR